MKFLLTGGCGFIGRYTIEEIISKYNDYNIIVLDNSIYNQVIDKNIKYYKTDITNFIEIKKYFENVDTVIHLDALSNTKDCLENPLLCSKVNILGTNNILEACRKNNVKRILCSSSCIVLGGMNPLRTTKIAVENFCELYNKIYEQSIICLRYSCVYGKDQIGSNVLNAFSNSIDKNGYVTICGDGKQSRDFLHVKDCAKANLLAVESNYKGVIDICNGKEYDLNYIAKNLFKTKVNYIEKRIGDANNFSQSPVDAKNLINFEAKIDLSEGIKDYFKKKCIVGFSGFVGSNIIRKIDFDDYYNSKNIENIKYKNYDTIVFCGLPGLVWRVNKYPEEDLKLVEYFKNILENINCNRFILISTINVYSKYNLELNEEVNINESELRESYGLNRLKFENFIKDKFENHHIIRLPAIYGYGIKKGILYDLLNKNYLNGININDKYQFYDLGNIHNDINYAIKNSIKIINLFTEPVTVSELIITCFKNYKIDDNTISYDNIEIKLDNNREPKDYNTCTKYFDKYLYNKNEVFSRISKFINDTNYKINNEKIM